MMNYFIMKFNNENLFYEHENLVNCVERKVIVRKDGMKNEVSLLLILMALFNILFLVQYRILSTKYCNKFPFLIS